MGNELAGGSPLPTSDLVVEWQQSSVKKINEIVPLAEYRNLDKPTDDGPLPSQTIVKTPHLDSHIHCRYFTTKTDLKK